MATKGAIEREKNIAKLRKKYATKRAELKAKITNPELSPKERVTAMLELDALPKNSSSARKRNRCFMTGEARGFIRDFGIGRKQFREKAGKGLIPGVYKESW